MDLEVGQVLWLRVKYQPTIIATVPHPMLVAIENIEDNSIEVIAIDKARDKIYQLFNEANFFIDSENPKEQVIRIDSYAQLNNKLKIEYFPELVKYRKTKAKLSKCKLKELLSAYKEYQSNNFIPDYRQIYMSKQDILEWNK